MASLYDPFAYINAFKKGKSLLTQIKESAKPVPEKTGAWERIQSEIAAGRAPTVGEKAYGALEAIRRAPSAGSMAGETLIQLGGLAETAFPQIKPYTEKALPKSLRPGVSELVRRPAELPGMISVAPELTKPVPAPREPSGLKLRKHEDIAEGAFRAADKAEQFLDKLKSKEVPWTIPDPKNILIEAAKGVITTPLRSFGSAAQSSAEGRGVRTVADMFMTGISATPIGAAFNAAFNTPGIKPAVEHAFEKWDSAGKWVNANARLSEGIDKLPVSEDIKQEIKDFGAVAWSFAPFILGERGYKKLRYKGIEFTPQEFQGVKDKVARGETLTGKDKEIAQYVRETAQRTGIQLDQVPIPEQVVGIKGKIKRNLIEDVTKKWNEVFGKEPPKAIINLIESAHPKDLEVVSRRFNDMYKNLKGRGGIQGAGVGLKIKMPTTMPFAEQRLVYRTGETPGKIEGEPLPEKIEIVKETTFEELPQGAKDDIYSLVADELYPKSLTTPEKIESSLLPYRLKTVLVDPKNLKDQFKLQDRKVSEAAVNKLVEAYKRNEDIPPVLISGKEFIDGGHRVEAAIRAGKEKIEAIDVTPIIEANLSPADFGEKVPYKYKLPKAPAAVITPSKINLPEGIKETGIMKSQPKIVMPEKPKAKEESVIPIEEPIAEKKGQLSIGIPKPAPTPKKVRLDAFAHRGPKHALTETGSLTNSYWLIKEKFAPEKLKERVEKMKEETRIGKAAEESVLSQVQNYGDAKIIGETVLNDTPVYILESKKGVDFYVDKDYLDYLRQNIKDAEVKVSTAEDLPKWRPPIAIYSGKELAAVIMPLKHDTPRADLKEVTLYEEKPVGKAIEAPTEEPLIKAPEEPMAKGEEIVKPTVESFAEMMRKKMDDFDLDVEEAVKTLAIIEGSGTDHPIKQELKTYIDGIKSDLQKSFDEVRKESEKEAQIIEGAEGNLTHDQIAQNIGEILRKNRFTFTERGRTLNDWIDSNMAAKDWRSFVNIFQNIYLKSLDKGGAFAKRPEVKSFIDRLKSGIMDTAEMEGILKTLPEYLKPPKNEQLPKRKDRGVPKVRTSVQGTGKPLPGRPGEGAGKGEGDREPRIEPPTPKEVPTKELPKKPSKEGAEFNSRVFERLKNEHPEILPDELSYEERNMKLDAEKAVDLIEKDKVKAYRIAMGVESSPDVTNTAVNIAMAEKALQDQNYELYSQLVRNRSLAQTRRGQELVAEKGSVTDNSTSRYVKDLIGIRMKELGTSYLGGLTDKLLKKSPMKKAVDIIEKETEKAVKKISKTKELDLAEAQALIDSLICK